MTMPTMCLPLRPRAGLALLLCRVLSLGGFAAAARAADAPASPPPPPPAIRLLAAVAPAPALPAALSSPDGHLRLQISQGADQGLRWQVWRDDRPVLGPGRLGLQLAEGDFRQGLSLVAAEPPRTVQANYRLATGKRAQVQVWQREQWLHWRNAQGQALSLGLRVADDGVAWRFRVEAPEGGELHVLAEDGEYAFAPGTRAWLQPMSVAGTGWSRVNPAYEEHYLMDIPVGTPSPSPAGWVFPALFRSGADWVALSEAGMDGQYHGSRLLADAPGGIYRLGPPSPTEVFPGGPLLGQARGLLQTPWRLAAIGPLRTVMESTLGTDLADPAQRFDPARVRPGLASWSWALLKDDFTTYEVQKRFIDHAAAMHWGYTLIDSGWDEKIGWPRIRELAAYARARGVGLLLWYNSNGRWNDAPMTPRGQLLSHAQRVAEFAKLREAGIRGIKVDFFGGDGASMIGYYTEILRDAADAGLLVNFHGATLPRGWARTWPNLMSTEAVKGLEFTTFGQPDQDAVARHATMLPFARNLFDPMDFTPTVFGNIPGIERRTRNGFELAELVVFLSGIQHVADTPEGIATAPPYVRQLLRELPVRWDETRFIDGEPGHWLVLARRAGTRWVLAAMNADDAPRTLSLDLGFMGPRRGTWIGDRPGDDPRAFARQALNTAGPVRLTLQPQGGGVAVLR